MAAPRAVTVPGRRGQPECPACGASVEGAPEETFHAASLFRCAACDLSFWHPARMPDASWYERAYQGRDETEMPLEPGHRFFLSDPRAPRTGRLLDIGCGVGNFLAAAHRRGFDVTGIEFNRNAVEFARRHYGLQRIYAARPEEYQQEHPGETFDVVTFFEVLEHQENPRSFLELAKSFVSDSGFIALSVPNRERWQKGIEALDYPPNHLTRWSADASRNFLESNGFHILTMHQEPLSVRRASQVMSSGLRTGLVSLVAGELPPMLADLAEMRPAQMETAMKRMAESRGHRWASRLARAKNAAFWPVALPMLPFLRLRGYTGLYLYCLAQKKTSSESRHSPAIAQESHV
ncbi:MAG TPA: class I SAM-dependent methyltransferase [Candidatus Acidoferrales bacterium]|nr:class I SAM-dependent methyltransferase [Candidatus Acidoferrales bacterium]